MGHDGGRERRWRGPAVLAALVLVGLGSGYAASLASSSSQAGAGVPEPVVASGPRAPHPTQQPPAPDPPDPPLAAGVKLTETTMGTGRSAITFPVPAGWSRNENATNEAKWKQPRTANNTYVMRIEQITSQDLTIAEAIRRRLRELRKDQPDAEVEERGADSLEYTYMSNEGTARHSFMRWLDLFGSGRADVEIVVHGRERDVLGTRDLIGRVAAGMRAGTE